MENNGIKSGDMIIIPIPPIHAQEWNVTLPLTVLKVIAIEQRPTGKYVKVIAHSNDHLLAGHKTVCYDIRRCRHAKNISKLENALYEIE